MHMLSRFELMAQVEVGDLMRNGKAPTIRMASAGLDGNDTGGSLTDMSRPEDVLAQFGVSNLQTQVPRATRSTSTGGFVKPHASGKGLPMMPWRIRDAHGRTPLRVVVVSRAVSFSPIAGYPN